MIPLIKTMILRARENSEVVHDNPIGSPIKIIAEGLHPEARRADEAGEGIQKPVDTLHTMCPVISQVEYSSIANIYHICNI
jgi:hypothetical protein